MLSVGLHKRYSEVDAIDESGASRATAGLANQFEEIEAFFLCLAGLCRKVLEAG